VCPSPDGVTGFTWLVGSRRRCPIPNPSSLQRRHHSRADGCRCSLEQELQSFVLADPRQLEHSAAFDSVRSHSVFRESLVGGPARQDHSTQCSATHSPAGPLDRPIHRHAPVRFPRTAHQKNMHTVPTRRSQLAASSHHPPNDPSHLNARTRRVFGTSEPSIRDQLRQSIDKGNFEPDESFTLYVAPPSPEPSDQ
jgi:hypothetical protein